ncbi:hypothetical protein [Halalkalibacter krulwichiae]|uniref:hypothetical protein n=1 Tax=Halalkalibacter krulwichiae TaxID=199441 RepID=UPI000A19C308|nr:hypothetical protein [Halalkalibacter krulwichiae]
MQATFVRIEIALENAIQDWIKEQIEDIRKEFPGFSAFYGAEKLELDLTKGRKFISLELEEFKKYFHSAKAFFEERHVKKLKDDVVQKGTELASKELRNLEKETLVEVEKGFNEASEKAKEALAKGLIRERERFEALTDPKQIATLKEEITVLQSV